MNTPNWDKTFTHSVEVRLFRRDDNHRNVFRKVLEALTEEGGSYAVSAGRLWLSDYSLAVFARTIEELTEGNDTAKLVADRQQERE